MKFKADYLLVALFIFIAMFLTRSVSSTSDTYWHLAIGKQIFEQKKIPQVDPFVYSQTSPKFTSTEWLSALIFYSSYKIFGYSGIAILRILVGLAIAYFVYKSVSRFTQQLEIRALAVLTVIYSLSYRLYDRPENFSYLFIAYITYLIFYFISQNKHSKLLFITPFIFLIWPSIHAFALLGLYQLTIYLIFERRSNFKPTKFLLIYLICLLLTLVQYQRVFYAIGATGVNSDNIGEFMNLKDRLLLSEGFQSLNQISLHIYLYLFLLITIIMLALVSLKKRGLDKQLGLLFLYTPLIILPFKFFRLTPMSFLLATPLAILLLTQRFKTIKFIPIALLILMISTIAYSIAVGRIAGSREYISLFTFFPNNGPKQILGAQNIFWKENFPASTVQFIKQNLNSKHLLTSQYWSNYYVWNLPGVKVFQDVLGENNSPETYKDANSLVNGNNNWQELIERYQIDTVVNSQEFIFFYNGTPVYKLPEWKLVYITDSAQVYAKNNVILNYPFDLSKIHPELETDLKFKKEDEAEAIGQLKNLEAGEQTNEFTRQQLITYYLQNNNLNEAKNLAQESRKLFPKDPIYSLALAAVYAQNKDCTLAKNFGYETSQKSFGNYKIKMKIDDALKACD